MNESNRLKTPLPAAYLVPVFVTEQEEAYLLSKIEELGGTPIEDDDEASADIKSTDGERKTSSTRKFKSKPTGWKDVKGRRSMYWGGSIMTKSNALVPLPLPAFTQGQFPDIINRVTETGAFEGSKQGKANHVRLMHFSQICATQLSLRKIGTCQRIFTWARHLRKPVLSKASEISDLTAKTYAQQPHQDGPAYFPTVATLSLGSHTILDIFAYADETQADTSSSAKVETPSGSRAYNPVPVFSILLPRRSLFILKEDLYKNHLHGIEERATDSLEELQKCVNWDDVSTRRSRWEMGDELDTKEWPRSRRVSLTMRSVEKVLKNLFGR